MLKLWNLPSEKRLGMAWQNRDPRTNLACCITSALRKSALTLSDGGKRHHRHHHHFMLGVIFKHFDFAYAYAGCLSRMLIQPLMQTTVPLKSLTFLLAPLMQRAPISIPVTQLRMSLLIHLVPNMGTSSLPLEQVSIAGVDPVSYCQAVRACSASVIPCMKSQSDSRPLDVSHPEAF